MSKDVAVVLCGGRGSRLGAITESIPKPMVQVHSKPMLWYILMNLYQAGFRTIILPLGYKGEIIREFVDSEFSDFNMIIKMVDTFEETSIAQRLYMIKDLIPDNSHFFLINGDTFFDFDIWEMFQQHSQHDRLATFSTVSINSPFGLIVERAGKVVGFSRDSQIKNMMIDDPYLSKGHIYSGLAWIQKKALNLVDLSKTKEFEEELFPKLIDSGKVGQYRIKGSWFPVDTQKDLNIINLKINSKSNIGFIAKEKKVSLANRYKYKTRYFTDPVELRKQILEKTVIPHQVEVQPGASPKGDLCWLKCPYCYGNTANQTSERLTQERYIEILKQIADGGVNKIVFAGYATDPLNYAHIDVLLETATKNRQIFGFHTKAIRVSNRFVELATQEHIAPLSYFSVSVDSGTNETYNKVHGIPNSKSPFYDRARKNVAKLAKSRDTNKAPLDISATYLLNSLNNSTKEVVKFINDFKEAGADLLRFTFPQAPRGYKESMDSHIPKRGATHDYMDRLRPIIEELNSDDCQVIILDLDAQYQIADKERTLPCFARFVFPTIGYDGWLYHCSESGAPHFREMTLGNLMERDFWDLFYDYDAEKLEQTISVSSGKMTKLGCRCDRKEHVVNEALRDSQVFFNKPKPTGSEPTEGRELNI